MTSQRQITLPLSKAVEIAYKSIRLRLSRSLLVTSGIVLALAFLMSILAGESLTGGMRDWSGTAPSSHAFDQLRQQRARLEEERKPIDEALFKAGRSGDSLPDGTAD